jgi:hypothetical protein
LTRQRFYCGARDVLRENVLPGGLTVGVKLLKVSIDLTDLVGDPLMGLDSEESAAEFERRLKAIEAEFDGTEREVFELVKLETVDFQACVLECARLWTQLRKIRRIAEFERRLKAIEAEDCSLKSLPGCR